MIRDRGYARSIGRPPNRGQATVELAVAFPVLILVALGLVQFALFAHAENVVIGAAQDGARVAAASDRTVADGIADARAILAAGLGPTGSAIAVQGSDDGDAVTITASGHLPAIIPGLPGGALPLQARASVSKESFRVGPSG